MSATQPVESRSPDMGRRSRLQLLLRVGHHGGMRVLIVDDSPAARAQARAVVGAAADGLLVDDLIITEAGSGVAALRELATGTFDLLLVDLHMPDVHGLDVLHFWQRGTSAKGIAIIVSTAVSATDAERVSRAGAQGFIEKPLSTEQILPYLRSQR